MSQKTPDSLSVSIVVYKQQAEVLKQTLESLLAALHQLDVKSVSIDLVDNTTQGQWQQLFMQAVDGLPWRCNYHHLANNPGFAVGHNRVLLDSTAEYHLVLNPDLFLEPDALQQGLGFFAANPGHVLLSPRVFNQDGEEEFLVKRYPDMLSLALRGFAPEPLRKLFNRHLACYELRDIPRDKLNDSDIRVCSGSCLLFRREPASRIGGFDESFFLYFEDFDFSLRLAGEGRLAYLPAMQAVHLGGYASRKGWQHIRLFMASARRFFSKHGWK